MILQGFNTLSEGHAERFHKGHYAQLADNLLTHSRALRKSGNRNLVQL
jgi:hypothetical protein